MSTVGQELRRLFPDGTDALRDEGSTPSWHQLPFMPIDVFGAAAHLLEASGAYQYIVAPFTPRTDGARRYGYGGSTAAPDRTEIESWAELGRRWSGDPDARDDIQRFWDVLLSCDDEKLVIHPSGQTTRPRWWAACHAMLVIADEASGDLGYYLFAVPSEGPRASSPDAAKWANEFAGYALGGAREGREIPDAAGERRGDHFSRHVALDSLGVDIDRHVARVFPKGRTTETGCTLRTFSHNLTLLPPHGRANAYWHTTAGTTGASDLDALNVLIVPFPYAIPAGSFHGSACAENPWHRAWGRFQIAQRWLRPDGASTTAIDGDWSTAQSREAFADFVCELLKTADSGDGSAVHAIVLPELSLDWETYDVLVRRLCREWPSLEFVVSGVSQDCTGHEGNQVASSIFQNAPTEDGRRIVETHSRRKHHRWQVDGTQVASYGLETELDPNVLWWEHHSVEERVLHVDVIRGRSTMTSVICEDLARVDPGLTLLRNLGLNLVFALLMDGPQIKSRWPGTYATGLADDPGSSVLSLTCAGMVDRSNAAFASKTPGFVPRCTVALWKNRPGPDSAYPPGDFVEIDLDDGAQAVLLRLSGTGANETTIDGRANDDTTAWYLRGVEQVRLDLGMVDRLDLRWITNPA